VVDDRLSRETQAQPDVREDPQPGFSDETSVAADRTTEAVMVPERLNFELDAPTVIHISTRGVASRVSR
jgi:hypothetical protein